MAVPSNPETATVNNATLRTLRQFSPLFPEVAAVAEFRPRSQTIHLHQISRAALQDSFANEIVFAENRRAWQTVIHELNHWADLCTTLWGRRHFMSLLNAYGAIEGSEEGYWRVIQHYDEERRILFPEYYHYVIPGSSRHSPERPWTIDYSAGREFSPDGKINSGQPIFFTTFGEHETREKIARQPLSIGSLLEVRAVYAELLTGIGSIGLMGESAPVESAIYARELSEFLYDADLTAYTGPIHLLSARVNTLDPVLSYRIGSELAYLALNLTDDAFAAIRHPGSFDLFGGTRAEFIRSRNYGYAFACMAFNAPQYSGQDPEAFVDEALVATGLPTSDRILETAAQARASMPLPQQTAVGRMVSSMVSEANDLIPELERSRAYSIGVELAVLKREKMPPLVDMNGDIFSFTGSQLGLHDPVEMIDHEANLQRFLYAFLPACRGMR